MEPRSSDGQRWVTVLVPGTYWESYGGWGKDNPLYLCGAQAGGVRNAANRVLFLDWRPHDNRHEHRMAAAEKLRELVAAAAIATDDKLMVIGHSHGANVALAAIKLGLGHRVHTLVAVNKPTMDAEEYAAENPAEYFYNLSAAWDWTQWAGSPLRLTRGWRMDRRAINKLFDTDASRIKPHAAMIWDHAERDRWWGWLVGDRAERMSNYLPPVNAV